MSNIVETRAMELMTSAASQTPEAQDNWLLEQLGAEVLANANSHSGYAYFMSIRTADDLRRLGKRILHRLERELHALLCGTGDEDKQDRDDLGIGRDSVIGAITIALTSGLGVAPAIAALVAAIIMRRLAEPTFDEVCTYWAETIVQRD